MLKPDVEKPDYPSLFKTFAISTVSAIFAYYFVFFFSNYSVLFFAYDFDIPASFSLAGISFPNDLLNHNWSRDAIITIHLSQPISASIMGIVFLFLLMARTKKTASVILLLFWLNLFAFRSAFGELIDDVVTKTGIVKVINIMHIDDAYLIIMAIFLAFILYKIGIMNGKLIKQSFTFQNLISIQSRIIFFVCVLLIPWLVVVVFSFFLRTAFSPISEILKNLPIVILLIPFLVSAKPENLNLKYVSTEGFLLSDLILASIFIILSIVLILVMNNGIVISG